MHDYEPQRRAVLHHIDTDCIVKSMPDYDHREKIKKIAKCHILYTPNYPILPYLSASFTLALTLHIDTN